MRKLAGQRNTLKSPLQICISSCKRALSRWQKSDFHLVKVHAMSHFSDAIQRSGIPFEYSSNLYEHLHIALMKAAYRCSNRKDYINYIVKHNRRLQALRKNAQERDGFAPIVEKTTALDLAVEVGQNILAGYQTTLRTRTLLLPAIQIQLNYNKYFLHNQRLVLNWQQP